MQIYLSWATCHLLYIMQSFGSKTEKAYALQFNWGGKLFEKSFITQESAFSFTLSAPTCRALQLAAAIQ